MNFHFSLMDLGFFSEIYEFEGNHFSLQDGFRFFFLRFMNLNECQSFFAAGRADLGFGLRFMNDEFERITANHFSLHNSVALI